MRRSFTYRPVFFLSAGARLASHCCVGIQRKEHFPNSSIAALLVSSVERAAEGEAALRVGMSENEVLHCACETMLAMLRHAERAQLDGLRAVLQGAAARFSG